MRFAIMHDGLADPQERGTGHNNEAGQAGHAQANR
jgi:hypothetical protein